MNVLIVNSYDIFGGAARAAYRLHNGLNQTGINSFMLVKEKQSKDQSVLTIKPIQDNDYFTQLRVFKKISRDYINKNKTDAAIGRFSLGYPGYDLIHTEAVKKADVINLHWVDEFLSPESISSLLKLGKPIFWTLHDHNPFTGGCHYSAGCTLYNKKCKPCPQLIDDSFNVAHYNLENKVKLIKDKKITIVSPSKWLAGLAGQSRVFKQSPVEVIPNSIDIDIFTPKNKKEAKREVGINDDCITLLTGTSGWKPKRKGFKELLSILGYCNSIWKFKRLINKNRLLILCLGDPDREFKNLNIPYKWFKFTDSEKDLSTIYNAADLFLLPSIEDNLPNTMLEAMSCATPVIAFQTGGMVDIIKDGHTGRLVPFKDIKKFADITLDLIFKSKKRSLMGEQSRLLIEEEYKLVDQAKRYIDLFSDLLPKEHFNLKRNSLEERQSCSVNLSFNNDLLPLYNRYAHG